MRNSATLATFDFGATLERLSTIDYRLSIGQKKSGSPQILGVGRSWFFIGFRWIFGRFWAVFRLSVYPLRISAVFGHTLRGFILPFLRLFLLGWVLIPPTTKAAYRAAKQPPQEDTKTAPEEYPGAIAKEKPPTVMPSTAFIFYFVFFRISDRITSGKTNIHKTANFLHLLI